MGIGKILSWLFIFVVGSLIASFLIYPNSYESFKDNILDVLDNFLENVIENNEDNNVKEFITPLSCSFEEAVGKMNGLTRRETRKIDCNVFCKRENLYYHSNKCIKDILYCYCE